MNRAQMPALSKAAVISYLLALAAYALLFTFWQAEPVPWNVHLVSILVAATSFLPLARWYAEGRQGLPMFELICLSYALQFSVPIYTQPQRVIIMSSAVPLRWNTSFEVLFYVELGIVAMMTGYYLVRRSRVSLGMPKLDLPLIPQRRTLYLWGALLGSGLLTMLNALNWGPLQSSAFDAILRLVSSQFNVAIVLLAYAVYGEERNRLAQVALYAAVFYAFLVGLTTGMLENALMPLVLMLAVRWHATRRIPWLAIVAGFVLFGLLNPAKFEYRRQVWYSGEEYGFNERLSVWGEALEGELEGSVQQGMWQDTIREALARFDLVHRFTYVREMTPAFVPYYQGETYSYFLYAWIPRLLWPEKPSASEANQRIDVDYGLKYEWQDSTISDRPTAGGLCQLWDHWHRSGDGSPGHCLCSSGYGAQRTSQRWRTGHLPGDHGLFSQWHWEFSSGTLWRAGAVYSGKCPDHAAVCGKLASRRCPTCETGWSR